MEKLRNSKNLQYRKVQGILGNTSFSLVLPKEYAVHLGLTKGGYVRVMEENGQIVIEKAED